MSKQETKAIVFNAISLLTFIIYGVIIYNGYQNGNYDTENLFQFYARVILLYIPITIVVRIVSAILYEILFAIKTEIKGEEPEFDVEDERQKLIELKTMRISMVFFVFGFILGLVFLALGYSAHYFFLITILFGVLSELGETALSIHYNRRGV
jgi:hypothetical protein